MLSRDSKIDGLEKQLKNQQDENKQMKDQLSSLEKHREYLLDKVERLHADKHKLEDRLSVVENNQVSCRQSISMVCYTIWYSDVLFHTVFVCISHYFYTELLLKVLDEKYWNTLHMNYYLKY